MVKQNKWIQWDTKRNIYHLLLHICSLEPISNMDQFQSLLRLFSEIFSLLPLFLVDLLLCYFIFLNVQIIGVIPTPIRIWFNFLLHLELQKATVSQSNTIFPHPFLRAWSPIAYHIFLWKNILMVRKLFQYGMKK